MAIYGNFVWWQGVVEDRIDPLMLGRCRVRILGYHTDDKLEIPTNCLPWATIMQPTTSAAMSGIGTTPIGPVEGTWVIGFFRDGENAQEPVIMGTVGGKPEDIPDRAKGFNDPKGKYPIHLDGKVEDFDTSKLARGTGKMTLSDVGLDVHAEDSDSLKYKRKTRMRGIPKALAGNMADASIEDTEDDFYKFLGEDNDGFGYWNEPNPRYGGTEDSADEFDTTRDIYVDLKDGGGQVIGRESQTIGSSMYPMNHVRQSESGHIEEWDDTPGAQRLHRYHKSGTFEEIQASGERIVKVVGHTDYELVRNKKVFIDGTCDITVMSDARIQVQGSLVHEIFGNYHLNVHGDMRTKISGNQVTEVLSARKTVINEDDDVTIGRSQSITVGADGGGSCSFTVAETYGVNAQEIGLDTTGDINLTSGDNISLGAVSTVGVISANTHIGAAAGVHIAGTAFVNLQSAFMVNVGFALTPVINIASTPGLGAINILGVFITNVGAEMISLGAPSINSAGIVVSTEATAIAELGGVHVMESGLIFLN